MPVVRKCLGNCGRDVAPPESRCSECKNAQRRARRNPGYDDPVYRAARALIKRVVCGRCNRPAEIVHHKDGNPRNNPPDYSNYEFLCSADAREADNEMRAARKARRV